MRPWFAFYDIDRNMKPTYLYGGFTPAEGTIPADAANIEQGRVVILKENQRFALYDYTDAWSGKTYRRVIARYDDMAVDRRGNKTTTRTAIFSPDQQTLLPLLMAFLKGDEPV